MNIRKGTIDDKNELQQLFVNTIKEICKNDYNQHQIEVWTSGIENSDRWQAIFKNQKVFVSIQNDQITGFSTLENGNYVDLFYVHKDFQKQGIAKALYDVIESEAINQNQKVISADVSITAKDFFLKMGFDVLNEQNVLVKNINFLNFKMQKQIL